MGKERMAMVLRRSELGRRIGVGRTAEILEWEHGYVVKLFLEGFRRESIEREANIGRAISASGLPVPEVKQFVEVDGRFGIVFERAGNGRTMLQELGSKPWRLSSLMREFTELHLEMHRHNLPELPPLRKRSAERIRKIANLDLQSGLRKLVERASAVALAGLEEFPEDEKLCHGDFHPDNILMSPRGPLIIDWSNAAKGNPAADVARTKLMISIGTLVEGRTSGWLVELMRKRALSLYLKFYLEKSAISRESIDAWELPVALTRMTEDIPGERDKLIGIIKNRLERLNR
jgi:aminoglycoside phosphotransferase (APT) family kinase protein